ncbi:MAG: hypothetical protein VXY89_03315 [SAR324 cluster bacterium]|nr:hypothetical protein [SAR324 cluster bacterium]
MTEQYTPKSLAAWLDTKGYLCPQLVAWRDLRTKLSAASNSHISFENIVAVDGKSASSDIEEEQWLSAQELRELILSDFDVATQVVPSHQVWELFTLIEESSWFLVKSLDGDDWSSRPRDLDVWSEKCERCGHWVTEDLLTTSVDCSEFPLCEDCFKLPDTSVCRSCGSWYIINGNYWNADCFCEGCYEDGNILGETRADYEQSLDPGETFDHLWFRKCLRCRIGVCGDLDSPFKGMCEICERMKMLGK